MTLPDHHSTHLADRILHRIEEEHLVPRPRWEFIFKNYVFWTLGALAVLFGALAFSAALFRVENAGWKFAFATHADFASFLGDVAPYLWICALALFILLGYANIRRTKRGYRYPLSVLAFGAILSSAALGTALTFAGAGRLVEESLGDHPPLYRPILAEQRSWWVAPEKGLLGGNVLSVAPDQSFVLKDFTGRTWTVSGADLPPPDRKSVIAGNDVRVVGLPTTATSSAMHACFVFPWQSRRPGGADELDASSTQASSTETSWRGTRSEECKGIRPYQGLRALEELGE